MLRSVLLPFHSTYPHTNVRGTVSRLLGYRATRRQPFHKRSNILTKLLLDSKADFAVAGFMHSGARPEGLLEVPKFSLATHLCSYKSTRSPFRLHLDQNLIELLADRCLVGLFGSIEQVASILHLSGAESRNQEVSAYILKVKQNPTVSEQGYLVSKVVNK